jgi:hypothetical protein
MVKKPADSSIDADLSVPGASLLEIEEEEPQTFLKPALAPMRTLAVLPLLPRPLPQTLMIDEPDDGEFCGEIDDATGAV